MAWVGKNLKRRIKEAGLDVKYIQEYLHLACPQSIYRWLEGKALPSVDHLYTLSKLFHVHMEDLLEPPVFTCILERSKYEKEDLEKRMYEYYKYLQQSA